MLLIEEDLRRQGVGGILECCVVEAGLKDGSRGRGICRDDCEVSSTFLGQIRHQVVSEIDKSNELW